MQYRLTRQASADIDAIIEYTDRNFGEAQTLEYVSGLENSFEILSDNPRMGKVVWREGKAGQIHRYIYRSHYVIYELGEDMITIITIRHTRQQMPDEWPII